ncbi:uncharacterized protein LOC143251283 [Tachypleus tridentatus]|uniref:uncharacterized protein LOC143251283 n=1 Tax=Tachypleus tridentatus TaxID=6853 RepID=UPI003FCFB453
MIRSDFCGASTSPRDGGADLDLTVDDDLTMETTVVVDCPISQGSRSLPLTATLDDGTVVLHEDPSSRRWVKLLRVSRDCHEQNVPLTRAGDDCLILETNRNIIPGEELFVWCATDKLFELDVPFLSPGQILGQQRYSCVACGAVYPQPNLLKAHIILACRSLFLPLTIDAISERLSDGLVTPGIGRKTSLNCSMLHDTVAIASIQCHKHLPFFTNPRGHCCIYCGKEYSRKYRLKIHVRTHTGHKPLKCKYCLRPFSDSSNLNKHVRLLENTSSPYHCSQCGKILGRRRDLERHLRSRHGLLSESDVLIVTRHSRTRNQ